MIGQFLIERPCPVEGFDEDDANVANLPLVVWVYLPNAEPATYCNEKCEGLHWRMTRESAVQFGADFSQPWVCEHMGHLIE
jgi:hypothetical protein